MPIGEQPFMNKTHIIAGDGTWIEGEAVRQLTQVANMPGMVRAVGLPDLHPGRGTPIGAVFLSDTRIYPHLVGSDIGCGMSLHQTNIKTRKFKRDRFAQKLKNLQQVSADEAVEALIAAGVARTDWDHALGTVGGGNHFAELQCVAEVYDVDALERVGLRRDALQLMVHSGSRGFGGQILHDHVAVHGAKGLALTEAGSYLEAHDHAVAWARVNRQLIADTFLDRIHGQGTCLLDICHNSVSHVDVENLWLHRKGAAPADVPLVVLPGSRGALSYLIEPTAKSEAGYSLAHGAGRKWKRSEAKARLKSRYAVDALKRTSLGSVVICEDRDLLYEEAPEAYKDVGSVLQDLVDAGLAKPLAALKPVLTFKKGVAL